MLSDGGEIESVAELSKSCSHLQFQEHNGEDHKMRIDCHPFPKGSTNICHDMQTIEMVSKITEKSTATLNLLKSESIGKNPEDLLFIDADNSNKAEYS